MNAQHPLASRFRLPSDAVNNSGIAKLRAPAREKKKLDPGIDFRV